jgi:hypothetical protein
MDRFVFLSLAIHCYLSGARLTVSNSVADRRRRLPAFLAAKRRKMTKSSLSVEFAISDRLLEATSAFVKKELQHVDASHDWTCAALSIPHCWH